MLCVVIVGCIVSPTPAQPAVCHGHGHGSGQVMIVFDRIHNRDVFCVGLWCVVGSSFYPHPHAPRAPILIRYLDLAPTRREVNHGLSTTPTITLHSQRPNSINRRCGEAAMPQLPTTLHPQIAQPATHTHTHTQLAQFAKIAHPPQPLKSQVRRGGNAPAARALRQRLARMVRAARNTARPVGASQVKLAKKNSLAPKSTTLARMARVVRDDARAAGTRK